MIKEAYMRGLTKRAGVADFLTDYNNRWYRAGIAGLATLVGAKALGAGWGTAGTLATLVGTGAYNTHNYSLVKNRLARWLGIDNKKQTSTPKPLTQSDVAQHQRRLGKLIEEFRAAEGDANRQEQILNRLAEQANMGTTWLLDTAKQRAARSNLPARLTPEQMKLLQGYNPALYQTWARVQR